MPSTRSTALGPKLPLNDERPVGRDVGDGDGRGRFDAEIVVQHVMTSVPDVIGDRVGEGGVSRLIPLAGHQYGRTDLDHVRAGEAGIDAHGEDVRSLLVRPG